MTPAASALLREIVQTGKDVRPLGDVKLATALQSDGMATVNYIGDGERIRVTPTPQGRKWVALMNARTAAGKVA